jgi:arrestin-2
MGLKFSKELVLANEQIVPQAKEKKQLTPVQEKLVRKFGANAYPFTFTFPPNSPSSVTLQPSEEDQGKPLGVEYAVKTFVTDGSDERGHKRSTVTLAIKKVWTISQIFKNSSASSQIVFNKMFFSQLQYAPLTPNLRQPSSLVSKGFTFSQGKINMEVTLDKEIYYHGEKIGVNLSISNNSRKSVKNIKVRYIKMNIKG